MKKDNNTESTNHSQSGGNHENDSKGQNKDLYISNYTWFKTGGPAKNIFKPRTIEELKDFLKHNEGEPYLVLGAGSNIMVKDEGFPGTLIVTNRLRKLSLETNYRVYGECGVTDLNLSRFSAEQRWSGLEFYATIPGTIGGAIRMNAGCNGKSTSDCLLEATCLTSQGEIVVLTKEDCGFAYRHSSIPKDWIIVSGLFQCAPSLHTKEEMMQQLEESFEDRARRQPIGVPSVGSTFKNPWPHFAWQLIHEAGLRGYRHRSVMVCEKHCNFITHNDQYEGPVSTQDFLELVHIIKSKVEKSSTILLELEVVVV